MAKGTNTKKSGTAQQARSERGQDAMADKGGAAQLSNTGSLADALNGLLADSYALYLKTKNFHWHVSGPHFRDYHLLFDEQAAEILADTDPLAERVRKIGHPTLRSIGDIARRQSLADQDAERVSARDMLIELRDDTMASIKAIREARSKADEADDGATASMLDDMIDRAEKRAWFLGETAQAG